MKKLSNREFEIVKYIAKGYTSKEVAKFIGLDYRTIENYLYSAKKKLNARNIAHAIYILCNSVDNTIL